MLPSDIDLRGAGGQTAAQVNAAITAQVGTANAAPVKTALNASGDAPIYPLRAWLNFNGHSSGSFLTGGTYVRTGTTVVINFGTSNPNLKAGDPIYFDATTGTATDGAYVISSVAMAGSDYTATFTHGVSGNTSGSCQIVRATVRGSGNIAGVADLATGVWRPYFIVNMPDANYGIFYGVEFSSSPSGPPQGTVSTYANDAAYFTVYGFNTSTNTSADAYHIYLGVAR